jgi:hypothetical protein
MNSILPYRLILFLVFSVFTSITSAQTTEDIQRIVSSKCTVCHTHGGSAPFPIYTSDDLTSRLKTVQLVLENHSMPPWKPDNNGLELLNNRSLSDSDFNLLTKWLLSNPTSKIRFTIPEESPSDKMKKFTDIKTAIIPDISATDTTIVLKIPFKFKTPIAVSSWQFKPTSFTDIHHLNFYIYEGNAENYKESETSNTFRKGFVYMNGWAPGYTHFSYSDGVGFTLPKEGVLLCDLHYSKITKKQKTNLTFRFGHSNLPIQRNIMPVLFNSQTFKFLNSDSLFIRAGTKRVIKGVYTSTGDFTLLSLSPHMHLYGKSFKAFYINKGDTIPILSIPDWDPSWQDFYHLAHPLKILKNSQILISADFDNTLDNPRQPVAQPVDVRNGWKITEEMLILLMFGTDYKKGDENLNFIHSGF